MNHELAHAQLEYLLLLVHYLLLLVIVSFNINLWKHVLLVIFNDLVLLELTQKPIFNDMVPAFSILPHFFEKLVLLVLSKIS
jgi:hypothetical protein